MKHEVIHVPQPRRILRLWGVVRKGLPSQGRYRRYGLILAAVIAVVWALTIAYILFAPVVFTSRMTLILPGSGVGGSMNVDSIGQATAVTSSAFSSPTLSPTENYKRLLMADVTLRQAARIARMEETAFPDPNIKLVDQTNLIEITVSGPSPQAAHNRAEALRRAFLAGLDRLRDDEASVRETTDRTRINELQERVRVAQRALLEFQGQSRLVSLDQFNARVSALDTLHDRERVARVERSQGNAALGRLASSLGTSVSNARQAMILRADPVFQSLLQRYAASRTNDVQSGATLGPAHATQAQLDAETGELQNALVARGRTLTGLGESTLLRYADLSVSDGRAQLFQSLVDQDSRAAGSSAALGEIRRQIGEQNAETDRLVSRAAHLADLVRDLRLAEAVFSSALARLDTNKSDPFASYPLVQTLEAPSLPARPSAPSKTLALVGAFAATIFLLMGSLLAWLRQPILDKLLGKTPTIEALPSA